MSVSKQLGVRQTPLLDQLFRAADEILASDPIFRASIIDYTRSTRLDRAINTRQFTIARLAISLFADALERGDTIDWLRLTPLYQQHYETFQDEDHPIPLRHLSVGVEGKKRLIAIVAQLKVNKVAVEAMPDLENSGIQIPQVMALIFALQYTIDLYREKERVNAQAD